MSDRPPIGVIGVGWVGLVTATCFAELGHPVVALDVLPEKIESLRHGEVPMHEPGLAELLSNNAERLTFTTEMDDVLEAARLLFCCVDTPPTYSGDADLSRVRAVVAKVPDDDRHALVMKSTVPSGTGASIMREMPGLSYVSCPEFLKEGSAVKDFMKPDRVVIGADAGSEWAADLVEDAYRPLGGEIVRTDVASAEMIKHASNAFLATKISFINEIANVCEATGADVTEVARGMGLDGRIGSSFLQAGIGYGGSCFVADTTLLVRWFGTPRLISFEQLWELVGAGGGEAFEPEELEAWSWVPGEESPEWMPVTVLTRRAYEGDVIEVKTKMGRKLTVTEDHPFVVGDGEDEVLLTRMLARNLDQRCWLPLATGSGRGFEPSVLSLVGVIENGHAAAPGATVRDEPSTEYRQFAENGMSWVRVVSAERRQHRGDVFSLEVPGSHTVVLNGGLVASNCFPKDVSSLKQLAGNSGYHFQLLNAVIEVNELQKRRVIGKLEKHLGSLVERKIALLGLAFKPNTDDMREASSLVLSARLQGEGARVVAYDPVAERSAGHLLPNVEMADSPEQALAGADAAILVTEWPQFAELDWGVVAESMATPLLIDGRNFLDPRVLREAGFTYEGVGRPGADELTEAAG